MTGLECTQCLDRDRVKISCKFLLERGQQGERYRFLIQLLEKFLSTIKQVFPHALVQGTVKKYTVARHSLSSHLWASYKPQSRINGFVKKLFWLTPGHKIISDTARWALSLTEGETVLGPSWWKDFIRRSSPPPHLPSPHDGDCKQTCSSSSGFRYRAADRRKKILSELVQMHLVELLMANSRLLQFSPICCSCIIDKSIVVSMKWPVSRAQITAFLSNIHLFTIISMFKTRGEKAIISTYEKVTSKVNHILACRASFP